MENERGSVSALGLSGFDVPVYSRINVGLGSNGSTLGHDISLTYEG